MLARTNPRAVTFGQPKIKRWMMHRLLISSSCHDGLEKPPPAPKNLKPATKPTVDSQLHSNKQDGFSRVVRQDDVPHVKSYVGSVLDTLESRRKDTQLTPTTANASAPASTAHQAQTRKRKRPDMGPLKFCDDNETSASERRRPSTLDLLEQMRSLSPDPDYGDAEMEAIMQDMPSDELRGTTRFEERALPMDSFDSRFEDITRPVKRARVGSVASSVGFSSILPCAFLTIASLVFTRVSSAASILAK